MAQFNSQKCRSFWSVVSVASAWEILLVRGGSCGTGGGIDFTYDCTCTSGIWSCTGGC
jgi:hypothetical protein